MEEARSYQVKLEAFEGPLDLLLFLIRKKKIDIHDIPIATITKDYLEYLNQKAKINLDREAEFLLIAALLIYIKSQVLLPRGKPEEEEDPRQILVDRLIDHQKIKVISALLKEKEEEELKRWKRSSPPSPLLQEGAELEEVSLFDLAESFFLLMKRKDLENTHIIKGKEYSIEEKMKEILSLLENVAYLDFFDYFCRQKSLQESLVSFFSLLELIRARIVIATQEKVFHSIKVWLRNPPQVEIIV
jgi:segregation and condensation protein A